MLQITIDDAGGQELSEAYYLIITERIIFMFSTKDILQTS